MAKSLTVTVDGLRAAAASSDAIADSLLVGTVDVAAPKDQPSHSGVSAVDAALAAVRAIQSSRIRSQAGALNAGGNSYEHTDAHAAHNLKQSM